MTVRHAFTAAALAALVGLLALVVPAVSVGGAADVDDRIVVVSSRDGDAELYLVRADGTGLRRLTSNRDPDYTPAWSPDHRRIAFARARNGNADVYVMDADGRNVRRLTRAPGEDYAPRWSPDGRRIAFVSARSGTAEIYVMRADGSGQRRLTRSGKPPGQSFSPAWSADGRRIFFASTRISDFDTELFSMRADGGDVRRLTRTKGNAEVLADDSTPDAAPDGRTIAFVSNRLEGGEIWVMRPDGKGQRRLIRRPSSDEIQPRFSPDGTRLVIVSHVGGGKAELLVANADGTGVRRLLAGSEADW